MNPIALIILALIIVSIIYVCIRYFNAGDIFPKKLDKVEINTISSFEYNYCGSSVGGHLIIKAYEENDEIVVSYDEKAYYDGEVVFGNYVSDVKLLEEITKIINDNNMAAWPSLPRNNDISTGGSYTIQFISEGNIYQIYEIQKLPENANNIIFSIQELMKEYIKEENLIVQQ